VYGVIEPSWETVRLFLHVLGATVWVGGQLVLAALVPALRRVGPEATRAAARAFDRVAWPAFGLLLVTGVWNVAAEGDRDGAYRTTLLVKLVLVAGSGLAAWAHVRAGTARQRGLFGALTGVCALGALLLGVLLAG
jgi:putative copper export protein